MAHVALGGFQYGIDKFYDKIPERTFSGDTYKPSALFGKNGKKRRNRDSRRDSNASGGSRGSAEYDGHGQDRRRSQDSEEEDEEEQDNSRGSREYGSREHCQQRDNHNRDDVYDQGNPNFPAYSKRRSNNQQDQRDGPSDSRNNEQKYKQPSRAVGLATMQQDGQYPPPPGQTYHRYNPADYRPQQQQHQQYPVAYAAYAPAAAYQEEPYGRPPSAGHRDDRRDDRKDDRGSRDKDKERRRRSQKASNSRSPSPQGIKGLMHKSLDTSERGLTTGAIGAIAGGLIANEVGKSPLATLAGVVLGGLGANAWEAKDSKKKAERRFEKDRGDRDRSSKGRGEGSSHRARSEGRDHGRAGDRGEGRNRQDRRSSLYHDDSRGQSNYRPRGGYDNSDDGQSSSSESSVDRRRGGGGGRGGGGKPRPRKDEKRGGRREKYPDDDESVMQWGKILQE